MMSVRWPSRQSWFVQGFAGSCRAREAAAELTRQHVLGLLTTLHLQAERVLAEQLGVEREARLAAEGAVRGAQLEAAEHLAQLDMLRVSSSGDFRADLGGCCLGRLLRTPMIGCISLAVANLLQTAEHQSQRVGVMLCALSSCAHWLPSDTQLPQVGDVSGTML